MHVMPKLPEIAMEGTVGLSDKAQFGNIFANITQFFFCAMNFFWMTRKSCDFKSQKIAKVLSSVLTHVNSAWALGGHSCPTLSTRGMVHMASASHCFVVDDLKNSPSAKSLSLNKDFGKFLH